MPGRIEARLRQLGERLDPPKAAVANYLGCKRSGNTLYVSGRKSRREGAVGSDLTVEEGQELRREFRSRRLLELGLICRADDRGEPVIQLSPPLIAGPDEFGFINHTLRQALTGEMARMPA